LAATDRTRITKPSPIVGGDQGQLRARTGVSREVHRGALEDQGRARLDARQAPEVLRDLRAQADPDLGVDLSGLNFDDLVLYSPPTAGRYSSWDDVPRR